MFSAGDERGYHCSQLHLALEKNAVKMCARYTLHLIGTVCVVTTLGSS